MKRIILTAILATLVTLSFGTGDYMDALMKHYVLAESSALGQKACGVCHVSDSDFALISYGEDFKKALSASGKDTPDAALWASLDSQDSDGDGTDNGKEFAAGTFPGDPASGGTGKTTASTPAPEAKKPSFPPKNAYHPAIVHFPIALLIAALVFDMFGMIRKDKTLLHAGWYNLVFGAVTALGGILSGVVAMSLMKLPYRGLIFDHLKYAVASTIFMWIMVFMRVHRHEKLNLPARVLYYLLAIGSFLAISWAGHLGGVFVYGE